LKTPFWNTRFGMKNPRVYGYEIHDGGGSCSACYALGHKTIRGVWYCDTAPGTMACPKIESRFKSR